jgi:septal ring-binding cell division protein DamX
MLGMLIRGLAVVGVVAALDAQSPSSLPASADTDAQLELCMNYCRDTFTGIEDALRMIEHAQSTPDPVELNAVLRRVGGELIEMRGQMSSCMKLMEQSRNPLTGTSRPAPQAQVWSCPMHSQIRQDHPGNCPLCDATLKGVADARTGGATTRPALAASGNRERNGEQPLRSTAGR